MTLDPRLGEAPPLYPSYGGQPAYGVPPPVQPAAYAAAPMYPAPAAPSAYEQRATMHPVHLPDLLSLISATSALQPAAGGGAGPSPQRTAAAAPVAGGKPATVEFSTERIKVLSLIKVY